jgi:hypothetical protein
MEHPDASLDMTFPERLVKYSFALYVGEISDVKIGAPKEIFLR